MTPKSNEGRKGRTEHVYERAADPAETADRPLEPKPSGEPRNARDEPSADAEQTDPHHRLNTPVGEVDPAADSDPYRAPAPDDESEHASGVRGEGRRTGRE